jgi:hypothetical protein
MLDPIAETYSGVRLGVFPVRQSRMTSQKSVSMEVFLYHLPDPHRSKAQPVLGPEDACPAASGQHTDLPAAPIDDIEPSPAGADLQALIVHRTIDPFVGYLTLALGGPRWSGSPCCRPWPFCRMLRGGGCIQGSTRTHESLGRASHGRSAWGCEESGACAVGCCH